MSLCGVNAACDGEIVTTEDPMIPIFTFWYKIVSNYVWMVPMVFGFPGNFLSVLVALRKDNRGVSTCVYMAGLATVEFFKIIISSWGYIVIQMFPESPTELHSQ